MERHQTIKIEKQAIIKTLLKIQILFFGFCLIFSCAVSGEGGIKSSGEYKQLFVSSTSDAVSICASLLNYEITNRFFVDNVGFYSIKVDADANLNEMKNILNEHGGITWIENEKKYSLNDTSITNFPTRFVYFQQPFDVSNKRKAFETYGVGSNISNLLVLDTGVRFSHVEFKENLLVHGFSAFERDEAGTTIKTKITKKLTVDGLPGEQKIISFVDMKAASNIQWDSNRGEGHGSHVAGIIIGNKNILGVCPDNCNFTIYKTFAWDKTGLSCSESGSLSVLFNALVDYQSKRTNKDETVVLNMSYGSKEVSQGEITMINFAVKNNYLPVAAIGNEGYMEEEYPAALSCVIGVAAVNGRGEIADFSSRSANCSVLAHGEDVFSVDSSADEFYRYNSGTSMAAPYVSGLAAYLLTFDKTLTPAQLRTVIEDCATKNPKHNGEAEYGHGIVDLYASVKRVKEHTAGNKISPRYRNDMVKVSVADETFANADDKNYAKGAFVYVYKTDVDSKKYYSLSVIDDELNCYIGGLEAGSYKAVVPVDEVTISCSFDVTIDENNLPENLTFQQAQ